MKTTTETRSLRLMTLLHEGIQCAAERTSRQLGNRAEYIGVSDIASYTVCPRKSVLQKLQPTAPTLTKSLTLQRGHWFEDGIAQAFAARQVPLVRQLEIAVTYKGVPIRAHLDMVMATTTPKPTLRILEIKSMRHIPEVLYSSYETQIYMQVALLSRFYNRHVFALRTENGEVLIEGASFPEIAKHVWGMELPDNQTKVDMEGWLLGVSMDDAKSYGPYKQNKLMRTAGLSAAVELHNLLCKSRQSELADSELPIASGFQPLCTVCEYGSDCPKFAGTAHPEWEEALDELATWKQAKERLETQIKVREWHMKECYAQLAGKQGDWVIAGRHRFRVSPTNGRRMLDKDSLAEELDGIFYGLGTNIDARSLFQKHEKVGSSSQRLTVMTAN